MNETTNPNNRQNRWLRIGGVVLLQIIMLIAAFSLGVYVERYMRRPDQPGEQPGAAPVQDQGQMPGQAQGRQNNQPQSQVQPPPGLTEPPQVIGNLAWIDSEGFEIITEQGPRSILIDEETFFRDHEGNTITPGDLQQGYILAVYGNPSPDRTGLVATEVVLLPPPPEQQGQQSPP